jgi:hypothetical protein
MNCIFCNKVCKNENSLRNHQRLCKNNPNKQVLISNFLEYNKKRKELGIKGTNQYIKAKELGLPKPIILEETRKKISENSKKRKYTDEQKKRHSDIMKKTVDLYPDSYTKNNVVGRVKTLEYNGVKLKGNWELMVAKWFDENNIKWEHETKFFNYEWNGKRKYYPDFYLSEYNIFIEVKGYETERDKIKWLSVPNLVVLKKKEIDMIRKNEINFLNLILKTNTHV